MPEQAPNIDIQPGTGGRLVYDKIRRTIVAQQKIEPHSEFSANAHSIFECLERAGLKIVQK